MQWEGLEESHDSRVCTLCCFSGEFRYHEIPAISLELSMECCTCSNTNNTVSLPMTDLVSETTEREILLPLFNIYRIRDEST
jgi:hypothetical protein